MQSAVVTGATSFIGAALVRRLLAENIKCYVIVRPSSKNLSVLPLAERELHIIHADASCPKQWIKEIPACDAFYHFAWDGVGPVGRSDSAIQRHNVQMALDCLRTAGQLGFKRFVFAGSQAEYGVCDGRITEDTPCNPIIEYGKAKLRFLQEGDSLRKKLGIELAHLRIFSVYGLGDHPWTLVSKCLKAFENGEKIPLSSCTQLWNYLYISEAADIIRIFGDCDLGNNTVFNVAGEYTTMLKQFVNTMWELCSRKGMPEYGSLSLAIEKPYGIDPDIRRMQKVTKWKQKISFEDGIQKMLLTVGG